uniref:ATP synthase complex subunit 8 n=1 Tax=Acetes chinensis TaxID=439396 RepID=H9M5M6_9EUCA|nr:ATP synthase F0 subunit 8 [Acetes chinensis]AEQ36593.1 ATP synthase F0 subunit 8 [Acetes chinensis]
MPQMSPLLWLNLFIMFSLTLIIFLTLTYFMKIPTKTSSSIEEMPKSSMNWKW